MTLRLLHPPSLGAPREVAPAAGGAASPDAEDELAALYAHDLPEPARDARVRANLVTTLDGAAAGDDGSSRSISGPADLRVLVLLRSLADVVLVGAGTARSEGYGPLRVRASLAARRSALGQAPAPALAVVTRSGRLPDAALARRDDGGAVLAVTCESAGEDVLGRLRAALGDGGVVVAGDDDVDLAAAVAALAERGLRRVLCEGGPALLRDVAAAGLLDELCLTTSPLLVAGDGPRALVGPALTAHLDLASLLLADDGGGTLLGRWVVRRPGSA
ncbi:dihydrofolate reductase family protein [uncultured Pseudokineococcus sp.]|uniref:dihydrofolate reductase family protein n=1 Tax=uncultured Pseudokineococcus sp. TaxID=1642928 RepID=UPI0026146D23|nr:dihydrofolate reductase family protein [uncultured Pseudokineococcus sp.]